MTNKLPAAALALQLALAPAVYPGDLERTSRVIETALALPEQCPVSVVTRARAVYKGRLLKVAENDLTLRTLVKGVISDVTLAYSDISKLRRTDKPMSPAKAVLITLGVLYGIGLAIGLAIGG